MMPTAEYWIEKLRLLPHPEGGFYRESYRSADSIAASALPNRYHGDRSYATSIYFLLRGKDVSHFHRIASDELWHFYHGSSMTIHCIDQEGSYSAIKLGSDPENDESFSAVVRHGIWFGATVDEPSSYALVGCTVAPGFDFREFELGRRAELIQNFPQHTPIIVQLTKP